MCVAVALWHQIDAQRDGEFVELLPELLTSLPVTPQRGTGDVGHHWHDPTLRQLRQVDVIAPFLTACINLTKLSTEQRRKCEAAAATFALNLYVSCARCSILTHACVQRWVTRLLR